ncbi:MAG: twin-arginine translocase subunit TatC [Chromatiaceae bacterium]|nr:twin-arginine translocase subunit TatC [Chromatiaceae bacterium]
MTAPAYHEDPGPEQPFMSHLVELRDRLLHMVMAIGIALVVLFPFANEIYTFIAEPIRAQLPEGSTMIATQVASPFMTPFKLALVSAVFVAMPYLLYQLWGFVAPGLYQHEKRFAMPLLASSIFLFYLGMAFAYYLVFPLVFAFFTATTPEGVAQMPDITYYLDFVLKLFFAFGVSFQIPIATILLVALGMTTAESLADKRPYVIVGCFIIGMLLTPPDVISQTLLAVPMWMLYEAGIFFSRFFKKRDTEEEPETTGGPPWGTGAPGAGAAATTSPATGPGAGAGTSRDPGGASPAPATQAHEIMVGREIDGGDPFDRERFVPLTPEEMEAELDAIEAAESESDEDIDPIDALLERVTELRDLENEAGARQLLYRVLADGDESQRGVAMNILTEMDRP